MGSGPRHNLTRQECARFGVEFHANSYQANIVHDFSLNAKCMVSASKTTPVAEDLMGGVGAIRPMTKPPTPIQSCEVNWASDFHIDLESLRDTRKIEKKATMVLPSAKKVTKARRGKF